jgi:hypothetical protein
MRSVRCTRGGPSQARAPAPRPSAAQVTRSLIAGPGVRLARRAARPARALRPRAAGAPERAPRAGRRRDMPSSTPRKIGRAWLAGGPRSYRLSCG